MLRKIYHVVGVKCGCTRQTIEGRCKQQGLWYDHVVDLLGIIPDHLSDKEAGDIEQFYNDTYGYSRGTHYKNNWNNRGITKEMKSNAQKYSIQNQLDKGTHPSQTGKTPIQIATKEKLSEWGKSGGWATGAGPRASVASPNHINKQEFTCPYCGQSGKGPRMKHHITELNCWLLKVFAANNAAIEDHIQESNS